MERIRDLETAFLALWWLSGYHFVSQQQSRRIAVDEQMGIMYKAIASELYCTCTCKGETLRNEAHINGAIPLCACCCNTEVPNVGHFKPVSLGLKCLSGTD